MFRYWKKAVESPCRQYTIFDCIAMSRPCLYPPCRTETGKDNPSGEALSDIPIIMITHLLKRTRLDGGQGDRPGMALEYLLLPGENIS